MQPHHNEKLKELVYFCALPVNLFVTFRQSDSSVEEKNDEF